MSADNSHAARKIAKRFADNLSWALRTYDQSIASGANETGAREATYNDLARLLGVERDTAADLLAAALASRAASRPQPGDVSP